MKKLSKLLSLLLLIYWVGDIALQKDFIQTDQSNGKHPIEALRIVLLTS